MNNYYSNLYNPGIQMPQVPQNQNGINLVNGEQGAESYLVAPNQTVVLFDSGARTIYLKSADQMGMPSIKILDYTIRNETPEAAQIVPQSDFATKDDISVLQQELDVLKQRLEANNEH